MSDILPTERFSNRVADYVKARPGYPRGVVDALVREVGFDSTWVVADVGAGTGISSRLFLENGNAVIAVEPNDAMRGAAEEQLRTFERFSSVKGDAGATTLGPASVNLVVAAQAFHWFDRGMFRRECIRILAPDGCVALIWNDRQVGGTPFLDGYEALLNTFGTDYKSVNHRNIAEQDLATFFAPVRLIRADLHNSQQFHFDGLRARLLSSSYAPAADDPRSVPMLTALRALFDRCQQDGTVEMRYVTQMFIGRMG